MCKLAFWLLVLVATDEDAKDQTRGVRGSSRPLVIERRDDR